MFVVDASVVLAWCFEEPGGHEGDGALGRLLREEALAPAHWPLEVANGLRAAERHGRVHPAELPRLRALLDALPIRLAPVELPAATGGVLEVARAHGLSAYEAGYLELARTRQLPLATVDDRLRVAASGMGIELVG